MLCSLDNASANDKALDIFKGTLLRSKALVNNGKYLHMRCCCHILNLIVQDGMVTLNDSIQSIRLAVRWLRSSPQRLERFREVASRLGLEGRPIVCLDVCTRWNSTYLMLDHSLKFRDVLDMLALVDTGFQDYFKEHGNTRCPDQLDWDNAKQFISFLKVFYDATIQLSASKRPASHLVFDKWLKIQVLLDKAMKKPSDDVLHKVAASMMIKFKKYWGKWENVNYFLYLAVVLDPRLKLPYVGFNLTDVGMDKDLIQKLHRDVKNLLLDLFKEYAEMMPRKNGTTDASGDDKDDDEMDLQMNEDDSSEDEDESDNRERYRQSLKENEVVSLSDEVDRYLQERTIKPGKKFKLLQFWQMESLRFPILSRIAKDIFAMPVSSVASECAFSSGSRVVDHFRSSLTPKMVEALICTNDWLRADGFSFYKEPIEEELNFYSTLEDIENGTITMQINPQVPPTSMFPPNSTSGDHLGVSQGTTSSFQGSSNA